MAQREEAEPQEDQRNEPVEAGTRERVVDGRDVAPCDGTDRHPDADPQRGAERVEGEEPSPVHLGDAGDDAVRLSQALDEARDHDDRRSAPLEELLRAIEPLRCQQDVAAPAIDERSPTEPADHEAEVVPEHRCAECHQRDEDHVEPPSACVDRRGDHDRLARYGDAEVLEEEEPSDREVAVVVEDRCEALEDPGQLRERRGHRVVLPRSGRSTLWRSATGRAIWPCTHPRSVAGSVSSCRS